MPKTTEANTENSRAALKWESSRVIFSFPSCFHFPSRLLPDGDVVGVGHTDEVQQTRDDDVLGAVIGGGVRDGTRSPVHGPGDDIQAARTHIAHESQDVKDVATIGPVDACCWCRDASTGLLEATSF